MTTPPDIEKILFSEDQIQQRIQEVAAEISGAFAGREIKLVSVLKGSIYFLTALTRALKGDSKQQGNWGEVVLARILSECGLREGHEYHTQVNIEVDKGKRYQPDVIVHLPQDKDIIIDAKVSLTAYERWYNAGDELEKAVAIKEHVTSVRNHIRAILLELGAHSQLEAVARARSLALVQEEQAS